MFNRRQHHRRLDAAAPAPRRPRFRRLAIEAMESRLLLTGNQLTGGNLDLSIYNLDSNNPYIVISLGDAAVPTIAVDDAVPPAQPTLAPATDYHLGLNLHDVFSYVAGPLSPSIWPDQDSDGGPITSIVGSFASIRPSGGDLGSIVGLAELTNWQGPRGLEDRILLDRFLDDLNPQVGLAANLSNGLFSNLQFLVTGSRADDLGFTASFVGPQLPDVGLLETPLGTSNAGHVVSVSPVNKPFADPLIKSDVAPAAPAHQSQDDDANVAVPKVTSPVDVNIGKPAGSAPRAPAVESILPDRRPTTEEQLSDAIDELLSSDPIIVAPSGETGIEYVADGSSGGLGTTADSHHSEQLETGGMIPIDFLIAAAGNESGSVVASAGAELAATNEPTGALGELSRVAVMELIEGEAEPGAPEAADRVMIVAASDAADPFDSFRVVVQQTGVAIALASPAGPTQFAPLATAALDAASRALATLVGNHLAAETAAELPASDSARQAVFSQLGGAEDEAESGNAFGGHHWNRWLAATPLVLAVAAERALAARRNRREQRDPAPRPTVG